MAVGLNFRPFVDIIVWMSVKLFLDSVFLISRCCLEGNCLIVFYAHCACLFLCRYEFKFSLACVVFAGSVDT